MTREEAKREILFAKREVMADSWIDKAYDVAIKALEEPKPQGLIRCKDCKYYLNSSEKCALIDTRLHFYETNKTWSSDSFCSWAE